MSDATGHAGVLLRQWRERRRTTQLALSHRARVSTRHLSWVETGRARPGRDTLARLAEALEIPLRERNRLFLAAGYAPHYPEGSPTGPELGPLWASLRHVLDAHDPFPAVVVDRRWEALALNDATEVLLAGVADDLLEPPVNVLRVGLHPRGLAPRVVNLPEWRADLLGRLRHQVEWTADAELASLYRELAGYPDGAGGAVVHETRPAGPLAGVGPATTLRLRHGSAELALLGTVATFGTATDVTLSELTIETFLPANASTADALHRAAAGRPPKAER